MNGQLSVFWENGFKRQNTDHSLTAQLGTDNHWYRLTGALHVGIRHGNKIIVTALRASWPELIIGHFVQRHTNLLEPAPCRQSDTTPQPPTTPTGGITVRAHTLDQTIVELHRCLREARALRKLQKKEPAKRHPRESGSLRRASMDLTRKLADLRQNR